MMNNIVKINDAHTIVSVVKRNDTQIMTLCIIVCQTSVYLKLNPECEASLSKTSGIEDKVASLFSIFARAGGHRWDECLQ